MSGDNNDPRVIEVFGIPDEIENEFLGLFFENKRRSGGGALASFVRQGDTATLIFEDAEVAKRVLSKGVHVFHGFEISVREPIPKDPGKLLFCGIKPSTPTDILEIFIENISGVDTEDYILYPALEEGLVLVQFHTPLSELDIQAMRERASKRVLDGAKIELVQVKRTDSVLVTNLLSCTSEDMLSLYIENKRGGGEIVKDVTMLDGGMAKVTLENWQAVDRLVQKMLKLDGRDLLVRPYFDCFLPSHNVQNSSVIANGTEGNRDSQEEDIYQDCMMEVSVSGMESECDATNETAKSTCTSKDSIYSRIISLSDSDKITLLQCSSVIQQITEKCSEISIKITENEIGVYGPNVAIVEQQASNIMQFMTTVAQTQFSLDAGKAAFLSNLTVKERILEALKKEHLSAIYSVSDSTIAVTALSGDMVKAACDLIRSSVCKFTIPIEADYKDIFLQEWPNLVNSLHCCTHSFSSQKDQIEIITLKCLEEENKCKIDTFLSNKVRQETVISMEPGMLKYIQNYCHTILEDLSQVSILPLEGEGIIGLRLHGDECSRQFAEEIICSAIDSVHTRAITLTAPGVARFLVDEQGTNILKEIQTKFQLVISLERVLWTPLESRDIWGSATNFTFMNSFERNSSSCEDNILSPAHSGVMFNDLNKPVQGLLEEAKRLVSVIGKESDSLPRIYTQMGNSEEDLYTDENVSCSDNEDVEVMEQSANEIEFVAAYSPNEVKSTDNNLEDDAMLSLAIQFSMDAKDSEEELKRALEMSKRMADSNGAPALSNVTGAFVNCIEDEVKAAHKAEILVYAGYSTDLIRVDIALNKKISLKQAEETVESKSFMNLSEHLNHCIDLIQRKHAVDISIQGTCAKVQGFQEYVSEATRELNMIILKPPPHLPDPDLLKSVEWVWYNMQSKPVPYTPRDTLLIECAWKQKEKKIDIDLDKQPCIINFEKMEQYNIAAGTSFPIARNPKSILYRHNDLVECEDKMVSVLPEMTRVNEATTEYQDIVKEFYNTINEYHNKIKIVKIEKVANNLLYNQYILKKASMTGSTEGEVERTLFHGTSEHSVKEICIHGFNRSFCGKNATMYGKGVYFAVNSSLSVQDQYSPPNKDGHKFVFIVRVLTGDFTKGTHEMKAAPLKENSEIPIRYHSVADSTRSPSIFVIFNDTQAYPEYLITCEKVPH
ncbi:protein mono-ADP-ribosyltransferase PARP10 isoform X1 [Erpetoichthys calabaricus]|uniref:protein mono-ADP-ribosyltransferase PARP10 isoform X1 n=1 Tax=Erpetoichthys calabaricus TaxID=27687 RepID=UPI002233E76E|nr:protein mono-ADP-ribosyltransferase PARP10 isoform X1 [Erpetoichthys calabaricus]